MGLKWCFTSKWRFRQVNILLEGARSLVVCVTHFEHTSASLENMFSSTVKDTGLIAREEEDIWARIQVMGLGGVVYSHGGGYLGKDSGWSWGWEEEQFISRRFVHIEAI